MKNLVIFMFIFICAKTMLWSQTKPDSNYYFSGLNLSFSNQTNRLPPIAINLINAPIVASSSISDYKRLVFISALHLGKQYNENWGYGVEISYRVERTYQDASFGSGTSTNSQSLTNSYGIGLFMRNTINPYHIIKFFLQPGVNYFLSDIESRQNSTITGKSNIHLFDWALRIGALYHFDDNFRFQFSVGSLYFIHGKQNFNVSPSSSYTFSQFGFNMNTSSMRIGFEYLF